MVALRDDREQRLYAQSRLRVAAAPVPDRLPLVRRDTLPEHTEYRDSGCHLAASCLRCPLPRCQYDEPLTPRQRLRVARDREIALLRTRHQAPIAMLAGAYHLTPRAIFRILSAQRA